MTGEPTGVATVLIDYQVRRSNGYKLAVTQLHIAAELVIGLELTQTVKEQYYSEWYLQLRGLQFGSFMMLFKTNKVDSATAIRLSTSVATKHSQVYS